MGTSPVVAWLLLGSTLTLAGCGAIGPENRQPPLAVATTTMLGSVLDDVVDCGGGTVETLMPIGVDPHDFAASSEQIAHMVSAELVVANGLELEEGLTDAIAAAVLDGGRVLEVAPLVGPIPFGTGEDSLDPHFWHDVSRMAAAAQVIGVRLAEATGDPLYSDCGRRTHDALLAVDQEVREILAGIPAERRVMVTDHDAFGYFAEAYDFEIVGVMIPGGSTLAEPSSESVAALVETIVAAGVPAIFANADDSGDLVDAIAAEVGPEVAVVELYVGSLGPEGSGAETYADMQLSNARLIAEALR